MHQTENPKCRWLSISSICAYELQIFGAELFHEHYNIPYDRELPISSEQKNIRIPGLVSDHGLNNDQGIQIEFGRNERTDHHHLLDCTIHRVCLAETQQQVHYDCPSVETDVEHPTSIYDSFGWSDVQRRP